MHFLFIPIILAFLGLLIDFRCVVIEVSGIINKFGRDNKVSIIKILHAIITSR